MLHATGMEETGVMERSCAVARGKDINTACTIANSGYNIIQKRATSKTRQRKTRDSLPKPAPLRVLQFKGDPRAAYYRTWGRRTEMMPV
jgi:hypothetical protein